MSHFAQALQFYRSGIWSREQLLSEIDRQLRDDHSAPRQLLEILNSEHSAQALPGELHFAVTERIKSWLEDRTEEREARGKTSFRPGEEPKTIFLDMPGDRGESESAAGHQRAPPVDVGNFLQGRFKLIERVGEGGMSRVYKAIDLRRVEARSQNPYVAVKVMTIPFSDYFNSMQALDREAHKLQSLTHPNIVRVIDVDRDGQTVFMTMEFLSGESLHRRLMDGIPREHAPPIVVAIANALEFAHRARIVHGDLKPGNVIITDGGEVKVIDFGIARFLGRPKEGRAAEQRADWEAFSALTPPYASPEMLENEEPDPRDDVYALACIAYELLTGKHPFERVAATAARDAGMKVVRGEAMTRPQFKAISGGLAFERRNRTPSAQAFIDEFRAKTSASWRRALTVGGALVLATLAAVYLFRSGEQERPVERAKPLAAGDVFRDCPTCPLMRVLPSGTFTQGSELEAAEQPRHQVTIAAPIAFAPQEVTIGEFSEFAAHVALRARGCNVYDGEWRRRDDVSWNTLEGYTALHPVSCVSWDDAAAYATWLSKKTGQTYRLPSASEWEYAARAGEAPRMALAGDSTCKQANVADQSAARQYPGWDAVACDDRYVQAAPVGSFAANSFGLYDMTGNVFEWVQDCWNDTYDGAPTDGSARLDGDCAQHEMRGGSWFTSPRYLRTSYRNRFERDYRSASIGFRVVREIHP
jgi:formylglycine-generating enzyme required for sulfatase activity/predicted Ser/Thr protein kinase